MKKEKGIIMEKALPLMGEDSNNLSPVGLPWIGGKKEKFKRYSSYFPQEIGTLVDLFAGGGTITFSMPADKIISNDFDRNIINLYKVIQDNPDWEMILDYKRGKRNFRIAHESIRNSCIYLSDLTRAKYMVADCFMSSATPEKVSSTVTKRRNNTGSLWKNACTQYIKPLQKKIFRLSAATLWSW